MPKVLFAAAEAAPFAQTGGLAEVIGSLPQELVKQGADVRVVLPKYDSIPEVYKEKMKFLFHITVLVSWRQQHCGVFELVHKGVTYYFVDNEYYFRRFGLYGFYDDAERYAFFSRAVLEILPRLSFRPDVIHCHDWHVGMISVFLKTHYAHRTFYQTIRTVFTIHNLRYQGVFSKNILTELFGMDLSFFKSDLLEFYDGVNFLKGGLVFSDKITTVSKTYAEEIQHPYFGERLDGLLRVRQADLSGIINGIDYDIYNPADDQLIPVNYDVRTFERKQKNKMKLQERLGLSVRPDVPVLAMVSRLVGPKGLDLLSYILDELLSERDLQLIVLGTGEEQYEQFFRQAAWQYPDKISANIYFDNTLAHQIYAGADLFLMPSLFEPCGIGQLIALRYGVLPVVRETGGLKDTVRAFNKYTGEGNGFSFANYNAHELLDTLKTALQVFYDKGTWLRLVGNAMQDDYSWRHSVKEYMSIYKSLARF